MMKRHRVALACGLWAGAWSGALAWAADQPQAGQAFTRNMVSSEIGLVESVDIATGKGVKWSAKLGTETYASPAVAEGKVLIGTNNASPRDPKHQGDRGVLMCFEEKTGKFIWQFVVPKIGGDPYLDWPQIGFISTPTVEGERVYTLTNRGELACLNINGMANGNTGPYMEEAEHQTPKGKPVEAVGPTDADILWLTDLGAAAGIYHHDTAYGSVLIDGDFLYINSCNGVDMTHKVIRKPDAPSFLVFEKKTGRLVAKDSEHIGPDVFHNTYSSASMGTVNGKKEVFFGGGNGILYAFEALNEMPPEGTVVDLKRVWKFDPDPTGPKTDIHSYLGNRKESPSTIITMPVFLDGKIYLTAGGDVWWGKDKAWLSCFDAAKAEAAAAAAQGAGGSGGTKPVTIADVAGGWQYEMRRSCATPAVAGALTFTTTESGQSVECVETATGKSVWSHKTNGEFWSSPLVADGKVYAGNRKGKLVILAATREKKVLCEADMKGPMAGAPVAANGVVYIATDKMLWALGK